MYREEGVLECTVRRVYLSVLEGTVRRVYLSVP